MPHLAQAIVDGDECERAAASSILVRAVEIADERTALALRALFGG